MLLNKKTFVRPQNIIDAGLSLLKFEPNLKKYLEPDFLNNEELKPQEVIADLSKLPLLLQLMSICPITDLSLERLLKKLRFELLMSIKNIGDSSKILHFQSALALQCFTNEYIYNYSGAEEKALTVTVVPDTALIVFDSTVPSGNVQFKVKEVGLLLKTEDKSLSRTIDVVVAPEAILPALCTPCLISSATAKT